MHSNDFVRVTEVLSRVGTRKPCPDCHAEGCPSCHGTGFSYWESISHGEFCNDEVAKKFGEELHRAVEYKLRGVNFKCDEAFGPYLVGLNMFMSDFSIKYDKSNVEKRFYHPVYKYTGKIDLPCMMSISRHKKVYYPTIIDWKSSTANFAHWKYQTAAYEELLRKEWAVKGKIQRLTVRLFPGGYDPVWYKGAGDFNKFLSFLNTLRS